MAGTRRAGRQRTWAIAAAAWLALSGLGPSGRAHAETPGDETAAEPPAGTSDEPGAGSEAEGAEAPAPTPRPAYEPKDPDERSGRSASPDERPAASRDPRFQGETRDLEQHRGESRPLGALAHSPRARDPEPSQPKAKEVPRFELRRPPSEEPRTADAPLPLRLCEAERDAEQARGEREAAILAYKRARRKDYPHGDAKALVLQRRDLAESRLVRAEGTLAAVRSEAAAHGVELDPSQCPLARAEAAAD